jgi:hypothetical protein
MADEHLTIPIEYLEETIKDQTGAWPFTRGIVKNYGLTLSEGEISKIVARIIQDNGRDTFPRNTVVKYPANKEQILKLLGLEVPENTREIIRVEPRRNEHKIWKKSRTWSEVNETNFRNTFAGFAESIAREAMNNRNQIDCADVALFALIESAAFFEIQIRFPVWNAVANADGPRGWIYFLSGDAEFTSKEQFKKKIANNLKAVSLFDRNKITIGISDAHVRKGDLILYDLQYHERISEYSGHTVIVIDVNSEHNRMAVVEGHVDRGSFPEVKYNLPFPGYAVDLGNAMSGATPMYRRFKYKDELFV